ncbi:MAG: hypothetical protein AB7O52_01010 [Planctomycetota bacterium]
MLSRHRPLALFIPLVLGATPGCLTFSAAPLAPDWTASQLAMPQGANGLTIGVRPLAELAEESALIGRPARQKGLAPFVLLIQNSGECTFNVRSAGIRLETGHGGSYRLLALAEVHDRLRFSQGAALWGLPFGILPAFFLGNRVNEQNEHLLADLQNKVFRDCTVGRERPIQNSILFFDVGPEAAARLVPFDCRVIVEIEREAFGDLPAEWLRFQLRPTGARRN